MPLRKSQVDQTLQPNLRHLQRKHQLLQPKQLHLLLQRSRKRLRGQKGQLNQLLRQLRLLRQLAAMTLLLT
jgi:hypothetical protein